MRKASLLPALVLGALAPLAFAQSADASADTATNIPATDTPADATADPPPTQKSAFGRVMGLMTQLLQEAGTRQAGASEVIASLEGAGVNVRVTPVDAPIDNDAQLAVRADRRGKKPPAPR